MDRHRSTWNVRTEMVRSYMERMGLEAVAFLDPGPYPELEGYLCQQGWEAEKAKRYAAPAHLLSDVRCVITALFPYYAGQEEGNLSLYCRGLDYHRVVREYFARLAAYLVQMAPEWEVHTAVCVDTGPVIDRYLALRGGLAMAGRNHLLYREGWGSYFFIGSILVNLPFQTSETASPRMAPLCKDCRRCLCVCPGGALREDGGFVASRCRSAITQKKGDLAEWEQTILRKDSLVFGCDLCQTVCPMNQKLALTALPEFSENRIHTLARETLQNLTARQFCRCYGDRAFAWRGKQVLVRNLDELAKQE